MRHEPAVDVHREVVEPIRGAPEQARELRPARRDGDAAVPVEVLADDGGRVAGPPQPDRQRLAAAQTVEPAERRADRPHAVIVGVLAGEERRPRGAALRERHERVGEGHAALADQRARPRHRRHVRRRLVVGLDHDHVGRRRRRGRSGRKGQQEQQDRPAHGRGSMGAAGRDCMNKSLSRRPQPHAIADIASRGPSAWKSPPAHPRRAGRPPPRRRLSMSSISSPRLPACSRPCSPT